MAIAYIASTAAAAHTDAAGTTQAVTLGAAVAVGDVIVGMVGWDNTNTPTITVADNLGGGSPNVYTVNADQVDGGQSQRTFRCKVTQAGTPVITVTFTTSTSFRRVIVAAYSGCAASPFDTSLGNNQPNPPGPGTGNDGATSTNITTAENNEMCVGFHQNTGEAHPGTGTISAGTNYTLRLADNAILAVEDRTLASAGAVAATFTISNNHASVTHIVALKAGGPGDDVLVRYGSMDASQGSGLVTAAFLSTAPTGAVFGGSLLEYYRLIVQELD